MRAAGLRTGDALLTGPTWPGFLVPQAVPGMVAFRLDRE